MNNLSAKERIVPELPQTGKKIRLLLDTDFGNEIDDIYALALALLYPERIKLEGIIGANYNNGAPGAGPTSPKYSVDLIHRFLKASGCDGTVPVYEGAHPMQYRGYPTHSEGVDFLVQKARESTPDDPLWVVALGASTDLADALLIAPDIVDRVRFVFHSRSEATWPERSVQFNVKGDIHAARALLDSSVPLVWFDTGTHLVCPMEATEEKLLPCGGMGKFLHEFRYRDPWFMQPDKGFYDMGDIAYLIAPEICTEEVVFAPAMDEYMFFHHDGKNGKMRRVYDIRCDRAWDLLFDRIAIKYKDNSEK